MAPVVNGKAIPAPPPATACNKFGYAPEFDAWGKLADLRLDFEASVDGGDLELGQQHGCSNLDFN